MAQSSNESDNATVPRGTLLEWNIPGGYGQNVVLGISDLTVRLADGPDVLVDSQDVEDVLWGVALLFKGTLVDFDDEFGLVIVEDLGCADKGLGFPAFDIELDEANWALNLGGNEVEGTGEEVELVFHPLVIRNVNAFRSSDIGDGEVFHGLTIKLTEGGSEREDVFVREEGRVGEEAFKGEFTGFDGNDDSCFSNLLGVLGSVGANVCATVDHAIAWVHVGGAEWDQEIVMSKLSRILHPLADV